jgi:hypothetical protein
MDMSLQKTSLSYFLGSVLLCGFCGFCLAQSPSIFNELAGIPKYEVVLKLDFESLNILRRKAQSFPAELQYRNANNELQTWAVQISVRGRYRRLFCDFPPLRIELDKNELQARGFATFNDLKWVTHCFEDHESDEHLLREYLAYGLYEELSPLSFRTQLLQVTYVNAKEPDQKVQRFAFVIEEDHEIEKRLALKECKDCFTLSADSLDRRSENTVAIFQYMIGNTDWSITKGQKNVKYFKSIQGGKMLVIPHDFDFSGFVDAGYSKPASGTNIANVRERAFLGMKAEKALWEENLQHFNNKRAALKQHIEQFPHLSEEKKKIIIQYLDSFFERDAAKLLENYSLH